MDVIQQITQVFNVDELIFRQRNSSKFEYEWLNKLTENEYSKIKRIITYYVANELVAINKVSKDNRTKYINDKSKELLSLIEKLVSEFYYLRIKELNKPVESKDLINRVRKNM